jgi:hypothetical protein
VSKTIWKYRLPRDGATIEIHEYVIEVLHIAAQDGVPTLWAIVDPDRPRDGYTEVVAWGTGWPLPDDVYQECEYWGTCGDAYGYIWHYFAATRFPDCYAADKATNTWDSDKYSLTGYPPYSAPTITISGDYINSAQCDGANWTLTSVPTEITFTADDAKVNIDSLIAKVQEYVGASNTATNNAYR